MITFYDNGGKTVDRYTMVVRCSLASGKVQYDWYSFDDKPFSPQGFNQFGGTVDEDIFQKKGKKDKEVDFDDLPEQVQKAVVGRLLPEDSTMIFHEEKGIVCSNCNK